MKLLISLAIFAFVIYLLKRVLDKKMDTATKGTNLEEQFLKEAQNLLDRARVEPTNTYKPATIQTIEDKNVAEGHLISNGYIIIEKNSTIDFVAKKDKKIALIKQLKSTNIDEIKIFLAETMMYLSKNEIYSIYEIERIIFISQSNIELEQFLSDNRALIKKVAI